MHGYRGRALLELFPESASEMPATGERRLTLLGVVGVVEHFLDADDRFSQLWQQRKSLPLLLSADWPFGSDCFRFGERLIGVEQQL